MELGTITPAEFEEILKRRKLRLVILDCPYDTFDTKLTQELFGKILALKIRGYGLKYPYGMLPVDSTDFVGTHILVCEEVGGKLEVLMGIKGVTLSRCRTFHLPFPIFHLYDDLDVPQHQEATRRIVRDAERKHEEIAYSSGWTVSPDESKDPQMKRLWWDLISLILVRYYHEANIPHIICGAVTRFKVPLMKEFVGFRYLSYDGKQLDPVACQYASGEKAAIMHLYHPSATALEWSRQYDRFWQDRLEIYAPRAPEEQKIAA